jgi:hypothetical protein
VLCELIRTDMEYGWRQGQPCYLDDYRARFPDAFHDTTHLEAMAFGSSN